MILIETALGGHRQQLATPDQVVADWVDEYVGEWWPLTQTSLVDASGQQLQAIIDADEYTSLVDRLDDDAEEVETFIRTPGRRSDDGAMTRVDVPSRGLGFELDRSTGVLRIVGRDPEQTKLEASRFLRNRLTDRLERDGWTVLHASCVVTERGAALILGYKGAGKTTSSLTIASAWGGALLANDRCLVKVVDGRMQVLPWPGSISIGFGLLVALGWFDTLSDSLIGGARQHPFQDPLATRMLAEKKPEVVFGDDDREVKAEIMPRDLTRLFGIETRRESEVTRVIFPKVNREGLIGFSDAEEGAEFFTEHLLEGPMSGYPDFLSLGVPPEARSRPQTDVALGHLARLPQFSLALGYDPRANREYLAGDRR